MNAMLLEVIRVQWTRVRVTAVLVTLIVFTLPLTILRASDGPVTDAMADVGGWLRAASFVGRLFPVIAALYALYLGAAVWLDDMRGKHVYALTLPISRERYVVYRFLAGAVPVVLASVGLLLGGALAALIVHLPSGVHAYPLALAFRFLVATLVCYSVMFAVGVTTRRAATTLLAAIAVLLLSQLVAGVLDLSINPIGRTIDVLTRWPGPFAILTGNWSLFDV